jgi:hypothetical protein
MSFTSYYSLSFELKKNNWIIIKFKSFSFTHSYFSFLCFYFFNKKESVHILLKTLPYQTIFPFKLFLWEYYNIFYINNFMQNWPVNFCAPFLPNDPTINFHRLVQSSILLSFTLFYISVYIYFLLCASQNDSSEEE